MKIFTSLLLALTLCTSLSAQLPNGLNSPNFIATDLDGNEWNLYDVLDQGKTVILNFSATWAGPCWNYHNTNVLQQFYQLHGPAGDNSAMVFFIEGDPTTSPGCISGPTNCVGGTQGDYTAGHSYPFIDDSNGSISTAFLIQYFPTIYMICSDKILTEVGQITLAALEAEASDCPVITQNSKLITGSVRADDDADCVPDAGENPLASWGVTANGQNGYSKSTISNSNGIFRLWVDSTATPFTLSFTPPNPLWAACLPNPTVTPTASDTIEIDHAAQVILECPLLATDIGTPLLRRCFDNIFYVEVCNDGTAAAAGVYVDVALPTPQFLPVTNSSLPFTVLSPGVYRFELDDLDVGECKNFNLTAKVSCDTVEIGETLCFEAHAYPDTLCAPASSAWNGASVGVSASCNNGTPEFFIKNVGTAPMLEQASYIVIEDDVMRSEGVFQLNPGESVPVNGSGNGSTWRLEAQQVPHHPVNGNPSAALEGCTSGSSFTTGFVLGFPIYDPSPAYDEECMTVIGSWDPNDKTGFPLGLTQQNLILKNTDLDYLIRFQNTGNDTAFTIVVRDTLSANLDAQSIQLGASSHPYEFALERGNVMVFTFKNIKLVDSFANEPASHGFLRFKIAQKPELPDGSLLHNRAAIYFDFNPPVITNTTEHRIGKVPHVSGLKNPQPQSLSQMTVYPNPLGGSTVLRTEAELPPGSKWVLYDFAGRRIGSGKVDGNTVKLGSRLENERLYHVEFSTRDGRSLGGATIKN